jgi:hypothetical protein
LQHFWLLFVAAAAYKDLDKRIKREKTFQSSSVFMPRSHELPLQNLFCSY